MDETNLTARQLTELFHYYSAGEIIHAIRSSEAFANAVYDCTDSQGQRFFIKILGGQIPEQITAEVQMQQCLIAAGIVSPEYLEIRPGIYVGNHEGTRFILSKFIPGKPPKTMTPALVESFGATLARLHDGLEKVTIPSNTMQWLNFRRVTDDLQGYDGPVKPDLLKLITTGEVIFERNLPMAVIHGDLWASNVFAENDKITTVFDLETAEYTVRLLDLARTYTSVKFNSDYPSHEITSLLIRGYNTAAQKPISTSEQANFNRAIVFVTGACATWHAIHGTRYRDPYIAFGNELLGSV